MVSTSRSDIVGEMIRGDLAESRAVSAYDVRPREGRPVVHVRPGLAVRWESGRRRYNPLGKGRPMLFEESDGS